MPQPAAMPASATTPLFAKPAPAAPTAVASGAAPKPAAGKPDLGKLVNMPVADAVSAATKQLEQAGAFMVGGGSTESIASAKSAATLLKDASMLVQVAHRNAVPKQISPELEMNLMGVATDLAGASSQVALAGMASPKSVRVGELIAEPAKRATDTLAVLLDHVTRQTGHDANPSPAGGYL